PAQLLTGGHDGGDGVAALESAPRLDIVRVLREEFVVEGERLAETQLVGCAVGAHQQHGGGAEGPPRRRRTSADRRRQHPRGPRTPRVARARSPVHRPPRPSGSPGAPRPPCASTTPRTTARPRPVPPRSLCAWRHESKIRGSAAAGMPTPVSSTWISISGPAS